MKLPERVVFYSILLGVFALIMPIAVVGYADLELQGSISAYYHTQSGWIFVIFLLLLALFLFLFGEYPLKDEVSLYEKLISDRGLTTIAGISAFCMALFATKPDTVSDTKIDFLNSIYDSLVDATSADTIMYLHLFFTAVVFAIIAGISIFIFPDIKIGRWRFIFMVCALVILIGLGMIIYDLVNPDQYDQIFFWGEFLALYGFGFSWIFKALTSSSYRERFGSPIRGLILLTIVVVYIIIVVFLILSV